MGDKSYDVVGVGAGPFNLSVAALLHPIKNVRSVFFERQDHFCWHPGMLLPNTTIQNSFLKDLVSFAGPISRFSFLAFLHDRKRLYEYVNAGFQRTSRQEFNQYLQWASAQLSSIQWGTAIKQVKAHPDGFLVTSDQGDVIARNLIVGTGSRPAIPSLAKEVLGGHVFHSSEYLFKRESLLEQRVAVIGGGQSGAEIVLDLLNQENRPTEIIWISARSNLIPLDESHFTNEWFTPAYVEYFWGLPETKKKQLLAEQVFASDGVSPETIAAIYQVLYRIRFLEQDRRCSVLCSCNVSAIKAIGHGYRLSMTHLDTQQQESVITDRIVLATGYQQEVLPAVLDGMRTSLQLNEGMPVVNRDFSLAHLGKGKLFVLNASKRSHGICDPNLSASAWRAASIINAILGHEHYAVPQSGSMLAGVSPTLAGVPV